MISKDSVKKTTLSNLVYLLLILLTQWAVLDQISLFIGITATGAKLILFVILGWYGFGRAVLAGVITYTTSFFFGDGDLLYLLLDLTELLFVGFLFQKRLQKMISLDAAYWLIIGCPVNLTYYFLSQGTLNSLDLVQLQIQILAGFFSVVLADILAAYIPFSFTGIVHLNKRKTFSFSRLMVHLSLSVMILPFLLYIAFSTHKEEDQMYNNIAQQFNIEAVQVERVISGLSDSQMLALRLNSSLQKKMMETELQQITERSQTDVVVLDKEKRLLISTFPIQSSHYEWKRGGEVLNHRDDLATWLPDGEYHSSLLRHKDAYIVTEKEVALPNQEALDIVLMTPLSPYLLDLVAQYQSQLWVIFFIVTSVLILSLLFNYIFFKPLFQLTETTTSMPEKIAGGVQISWLDSRIKEISILVENFLNVSRKLESMFTQVHHLAYFDSLTGLPNRLFFRTAAEQRLREYTQSPHAGEKFALLFIDLDRFKEVNDTYGHDVGDQLLREFSNRLPHDNTDQLRAFRISGDEFVILMTIDQVGDAASMAERLLNVLAQPVKLQNTVLHAACSIGIAHYPDHGDTLDELIKHADTAMYEAKLNGRNQYALFRHKSDQ
ncbi:GGDEF domain-containing protein [Paenibacillus ihuae]|uniref:GGDEF domain-containing protein n=1 Tax=Paenibacillus ihuae TaxID=1232431 RepID=UPI0006D57688|nr:GGDEF domain-containing protein [Paenibacillus ihuae]